MKKYYREFLNWFHRLRSLVYGVLFLGYIWFIHPIILGMLVTARQTGQTFLGLGLLVVLIQVLEPIAIMLKGPAVRERIRRWPNKAFAPRFGIGLAQLCHLFLAMMVFLHVMPLFGIDGMCFDYDTRLVPCLLTNLVFIAILAKEAVVFYQVLNLDQASVSVNLEAPAIKIREMLGEVPLLVFAMITFSLSWSAIMSYIDPIQEGELMFSLLSSLILFLMLYPTSRLVFLAEEWLVEQPSINRIINIGFFLTTMLAALQEVPGLF